MSRGCPWGNPEDLACPVDDHFGGWPLPLYQPLPRRYLHLQMPVTWHFALPLPSPTFLLFGHHLNGRDVTMILCVPLHLLVYIYTRNTQCGMSTSIASTGRGDS